MRSGRERSEGRQDGVLDGKIGLKGCRKVVVDGKISQKGYLEVVWTGDLVKFCQMVVFVDNVIIAGVCR